jgi:Na+-translocating ferredoxin:NAD+ oxidoreductase subunit E
MSPTGKPPPAIGRLMIGLWENNPGLVQLLGICPLLAVTTTLVNGIGLGVATLFVMCATNVVISAVRRFIPQAVRLPAYVLIIAALVTVAELLCKAYFFELYLALGIFLPLIVTNCTILGRAESFASKNPVGTSLLDGLGHGLGFAAVLVIIGAARELLGHGTLLSGSEQLFGGGTGAGKISLSDGGDALRLALLPAGAFFVLAVLVAIRNAAAGRRKQQSTET